MILTKLVKVISNNRNVETTFRERKNEIEENEGNLDKNWKKKISERNSCRLCLIVEPLVSTIKWLCEYKVILKDDFIKISGNDW